MKPTGSSENDVQQKMRLSQNANRTGGVRDSLLIMGRKQELIKKGNIKKAINEVAKML